MSEQGEIVKVRCSACGRTAEVRADALGKAGRCNACGQTMALPPKGAKLCVGCGENVTDRTRYKDSKRQYLCERCWEASRSDRQGEQSPSDQPQPVTAAGGTVADLKVESEEHPEEQWTDVPTFTPSGSARAGRSASGGAGMVLAALALALSVATAVRVWNAGAANSGVAEQRAVDEQRRVKLMVLKGQAEVLAQLGHKREAVALYEQLQEQAGTLRGKDASLDRELEQAAHARMALVMDLADGGTPPPQPAPAAQARVGKTMDVPRTRNSASRPAEGRGAEASLPLMAQEAPSPAQTRPTTIEQSIFTPLQPPATAPARPAPGHKSIFD